MVLTRSMATTSNNVQGDESRPTTLERQVQTLIVAVEHLTKQTRFWKNNYARRRGTILRKRTKKVPLSSEGTKRGQRVGMPQVDRSDKT